MLRTITTLIRARTAEAGEALEAAEGPTLLAQHLRDAEADLRRGRNALARLVAEEKAERRRAEAAIAEIARREAEASAALTASEERLAEDLATRIVTLEEARDRAEKAAEATARRIETLRTRLSEGERRLKALAADLRAARAARLDLGVRRRLDDVGRPSSALAEAEALSRRLSEGTQAAEDMADALATPADEAADLDTRLADAGIADDRARRRAAILDRLKSNQPSTDGETQ
ncbi:MAG: PspA/IM30 family protein [Pseudomonadota bacterium]